MILNFIIIYFFENIKYLIIIFIVSCGWKLYKVEREFRNHVGGVLMASWSLGLQLYYISIDIMIKV